MAGGWVAAAGMLAGLCARAAGGGGQYVTTSLLGAGLLLHSGVFERDGEVVRLASVPEMASLPPGYTPLRTGPDDGAARQAETVLEAAFATAPAAAWVGRLRALGLLAELIEPLDRDGFRRAVLDDPVNRQLGRVVSFPTADWGRFEQIGPLLRCGPEDFAGPRLMLPGVGEHTVEILGELGFTPAEIDALLAAKVARQLEPGA